ncbi:MAG TPA: glycerol-3-phosphate responsive antiterminator [Desulfobacteria bacterium]|nr:glycerol-3-phosphate responsive antiterminator [Desulfobacteria bacterium]
MNFKQVLAANPIVPALKHTEDLAEVLSKAWIRVVFLLGADINTLEPVIKQSQRYPNKLMLADVDLMEGIGKDAAGIAYLKRMGLAGVVSVKSQLLNYAKENKMLNVQRLFLIDSEAIRTGVKVIKRVNPDAIEILPATVPKFAIEEFQKVTDASILGGGLLRSEQDVRVALANGLTAITASRRNLWNIRLT